MDKQQQFYGTPLIRSLKNANELDNNEASTSTSSSYKNRKARLDYQQTVRDSEGRQRFHGAFTGGFSAGYYNSVDTKEGFRPKEFVSHRSSKHGGATRVEHRPEDYMDDEDLGEFGIAPRKIRVNNIYSEKESDSSSRNVLLKALQPVANSIGDRILAAASGSSLRRGATSSESVLTPVPPVKNNYHGLGYQPLRRSERSDQTSSHPLMAMLGQGKRLKISGEAFGSGVLEDEGDDLLYDGGVNGVYDDMKNYDFSQVATSRRSDDRSQKTKDPSNDEDDNFERDPYALPGFVLASDLSALNITDSQPKYPPPRIPSDWRMPARSEPYVPPVKENPEQELLLQRLKTGTPLGDKFTSAIKPHESTDMDTKQGLLHYSDLKSTRNVSELEPSAEQSSQEPASISRRILEWRPCSLLCKRFNLQNPFPDNQFVGVRPSDLVVKDAANDHPDSPKTDTVESYHIAPIDLRRSIFNVIFDNVISTKNNIAEQLPIQTCQTSESEDEEDAPQVVILSGDSSSGLEDTGYALRDETPDPEVIVIPKPRLEPEVIVLDSSSSSSSSSPSTSDRSHRRKSTQQADDDPDAYGPPLPPSIRTLINTNREHSSSHKSKKSKKKKKKKHKKHK